MKKIIFALLFVFALALPVSAAEVLPDGSYTVEVTLSGGTGKATVASPANVTVTNGQAVATICWSSSNYDRMTVAGTDYYTVNSEGNSVFEIPVILDTQMDVLARTTAMSQPHDIAYTLYFDSSTRKGAKNSGAVPITVAVLVVLTAGTGLVVTRKRRKAA